MSQLSRSSSFASVLSEIGPLKPAAAKTGKKRGRKPMQSAILTSPDNMAVLKEKKKAADAKKAAAEAKKATPKKKAIASPPAKRAKKTKQQKSPAKDKSSSSSSEDDDFCIICIKKMPKKLTAANSIKCNVCRRAVHLKCANMSGSYFTCKHCDSDWDEEDDE